MITSKLNTGIKPTETYPALYRHTDGSVYLFKNRNMGICVKPGHENDYIGRNLDGINSQQSGYWTRLGTDEEIILKNID